MSNEKIPVPESGIYSHANKMNGIVRAFLVAGLSISTFLASSQEASAVTPPKQVTVRGVEEWSSSEATDEARPLPPPTPTVESDEIALVEASGVILPVKDNPRLEEVSISLPGTLLEGENSILEDGQPITVFFTFESERPIDSISVPLGGLFGKSIGGTDAVTLQYPEEMSQPSRADIPFTRIFGDRGYEPDEELLKSLSTLQVVIQQFPDEKYLVRLDLPNEEFTVEKSGGSLSFNPAEAFLLDPIIRIDRSNPSAREDTVYGPSRLALEIDVSGAYEFKTQPILLEPPQQIRISIGEEDESGNSNVPVVNVAPDEPSVEPVVPTATADQTTKQPERKIIIQSGPHANADGSSDTQATEADISDETGSTWIREYAPNETVSLREWWDDMVSKGYIVIDDLAYQYGGDLINETIENKVLVPNPDEYWESGQPFVGDCYTRLEEIGGASQGHIDVKQQAIDQIPGGPNCAIYVAPKDLR